MGTTISRAYSGIAPLAAAVMCVGGCGDSTVTTATAQQAPAEGPRGVSAIGRLEPQHGVMRISAASVPESVQGAILTELHVEVGDDVSAGQLLAVTDTAEVLRARIEEAKTELALAEQQAAASRSSADAACVRSGVLQREADRLTRLLEKNLAAEDETDRAEGAAQASAADCTAARSAAAVAEAGIEVNKARVRRQQAELERAYVRTPVAARVLAINARPGEQIGVDGILEIGRVDRMYAIAEVFETDAGRLRPEQAATISSDALPRALTGRIERIRPLVRNQAAIAADPAARRDARVVEVEVRLDEPELAEDLTNLQVDVVFDP